MKNALLPAVVTAVLALSAPATAQTWPSKPIKVIVPFGAGSATDIVPRIVMERVSQQLGQPVIFENRAGAGSTTGTALVAKADPDGLTWLATSSAFTVTPAIYDALSYDPVKDLVAVIPFGSLPTVMVVTPSAAYKTLAEFVTAAKAKPGSFNFASVGVGTGTHMGAERFRLSAGYEAAHVPFKSGSEALTEVIAGRIEYYFCPSGTAIPLVRDNRVRALAVGSPQRVLALPDVPTTLEAGYKDSDYAVWVGLLAPAKTPRDIVERMHKEITAALAHPEVRNRLEPNGVEPLPLTPAAFDAQIAAEIKTNAVLAKTLALKPN